MRLFIGIDLPEELRLAIYQFQSELRQLGVRGSWKVPKNLHITLEFLGELEPHTILPLQKALVKVAAHHLPFSLSIGGLGVFPSWKRPHTLWTAVSSGFDALHKVRDELHQELTHQGFVLENRPFKPHLTLASRPELDAQAVSTVAKKVLGTFQVTELILFESKAIRGQRVYTALFRAPLQTSGMNPPMGSGAFLSD